jgi:hypothetical protein
MRKGLQRYVFGRVLPAQKHKSGKPGFRRFAPEMRPKEKDKPPAFIPGRT